MLVLKTLLSHYRTHPVQALFLVTGIAVANLLLVGTLLINAQARASYAEGAGVFGADSGTLVSAADGSAFIDEGDYFALRRQGFDQLAPILVWSAQMQDGGVVQLVGIDLFAMPRPAGDRGEVSLLRNPDSSGSGSAGDFVSPPWQLWAAPLRIRQLGLAAGETIILAGGARLPPLVESAAPGLGHRLMLDIGALQSISNNQGQLSGMIVFPGSGRPLEELKQVLPQHLTIGAGLTAPDPAELTNSFHLNLTAMGLLAFVVGVFLTFNAISFSYSDRSELIRKLKICGVSRRELAAGLITELCLFALAGLIVGYLGGAWLALRLLPGVGQTLAALYGVYISYPDSLIGSGLGVPVLMTALAGGLCAVSQLPKALSAPPIRRKEAPWQQQAAEQRDRLLLILGVGLVALSVLATSLASTLVMALTGMACLLLGAVLCLPACARGALALIGRFIRPENASLTWLLADTRWLLGPASLALMAMTLALISNSGLNTMIHSFRLATEQWLEHRLVAGLYLATPVDEGELQRWLDIQAPGSNVVGRYYRDIGATTPEGKSVVVELTALPSLPRFASSVELIRSDGQAQTRFSASEGVFVSERAYRIEGWRLGDRVTVCAGLSVPVVAIYRNYGNPQPQWLISQEGFESCWPAQQPSGRAIVGPPAANGQDSEPVDWTELVQLVRTDFALSDRQVIAAPALKAIGLGVFDRTFAVTRALNALTLLVAGIGIFCAVSAIHHHRRRNQALLACLGMSRKQRAGLQAAQWGLLGALSMLVVWPFGTALAWVLAQVVTPVAFGWSFPLQLQWQHYPALVLLACASLLLAGLLPGIQALRLSPAQLLREVSA